MNYVHYSKPDTKLGELEMEFKPLQKIDYATKRCDDDIEASRKLLRASKYVGIFALSMSLWMVVLHLAFNAAM